jgi:hypothetical protein
MEVTSQSMQSVCSCHLRGRVCRLHSVSSNRKHSPGVDTTCLLQNAENKSPNEEALPVATATRAIVWAVTARSQLEVCPRLGGMQYDRICARRAASKSELGRWK